MPDPLETPRSLARHPAVLAGAAALLAGGAAAGALPLLETPGYELGEAAALLAALVAPAAGVAAARRELRGGAPSPLAACAAAAGVTLALAGAAVAGALARAALGPCAVLGPALAYVPLLAVPSALLGAALAVAAGFLAGGRRALGVLLYAAGALASLAASLLAAYRGPAAFVFDPLLGAWPGPIYDEAVVPDLRVLLHRGGAVAWAAAIAAGTEAVIRARARGSAPLFRPLPPRGGGRGAAEGSGPSRGWRRAAPPIVALLALAVAVGCAAAREALGISGSRAALARALGGRRDGPRCTIVFPAEKPAPAAAALLDDCEFQAADLAAHLGFAARRVTVFVYRSTAEKRRLVGAASTEYAKPWLSELHVVDAPLPHPLLRHELVHALAAPVAGGPLGVPARSGVLVSAGLVEGLAAALETPRGRFTVHEWSRAARELGLLPDVAAIVGPAGFYREPPARAYTAAGSFLAFVLERHGPAAVREAYRTGDVARAAGVPLAALVAEWHASLDRLEPPGGLLQAARPRLSRGSLFSRRCAREVAVLEARGAAAAARGSTAAACALYEAAAARSGEPGDLKVAGDLRVRAGDLAGAARAYREAARRAGDADAPLRAALAGAEGDLAWRRGELAAAAASWAAALAARPERGEARLLEAKLVAAADPELGPAARPYLLGDGDPAAALAALGGAPQPLAAYLRGRARAARGEEAGAVPELERAVRGPLPPELAREAALLLGVALCASGAVEAGLAALAPLLAEGSAADRARADEARRRCEFRRDRRR